MLITEIKGGTPFDGEKFTVTPLGWPLAHKSTSGPPGGFAMPLTVAVVEPPCGTVAELGDTLTDYTLSMNLVVATLVPSVAVTAYVPG